ncbi:MAG: hypothetical protein A2145_00440, partial [candidate division Zixibacteria bacterium RBG_16_40_9]
MKLSILTPEIFLLTWSGLVLVLNYFVKTKAYIVKLSISGLAITAIILFFSPKGELFRQAFLADDFSLIFKIIFLVSAIFTLLSWNQKNTVQAAFLLLLSSLVCMLLVSTAEILTFLAAWCLLAVCLYFLIYRYSSQISWQYLILQMTTILIFVLGASLIFGITGATSFSDIKISLVLGFFQGGTPGLVLVLAIILILVSLSIQLSVFPFHTSWVRLFQELPTPLVAFFNISIKLAFLAFLMRFFIRSFLIYHPQWIKVLSFLAATSLLYGALKIFKETDFKKILTNFTIFQTGLILIGIVSGTQASIEASIFYIWAYFFSNWGIYTWLLVAEKNHYTDWGLSGIFKKSKILAVVLTVLLFSLAGLPFTGGFWGRAYLFESAWSFRRFTLVTVGVITSILAIIYLWRQIKKIFTTSSV